ncbi:MAG: class I SAM-dependent RNA methyltransferase [Dermatophilaceae bacterium]
MTPGPVAPGLAEGDEVEVEVTAFAHGGHAVARHEGQVLFVRHALPGERVLARVTEVGAGARFVRADAVAVTSSSPDRVEPPCPWAGPGRCGGCDLQHVSVTRQRELKAGVVREQLSRLAGLDLEVVVEPVPGDREGLGWRTRVEYAVDADGRAGLRRHRSHDVVAVDRCRIAAAGVDALGVTTQTWPGTVAVDAVAPSVGAPVAVPVARGGEAASSAADARVVEEVRASWTRHDGSHREWTRRFVLPPRGFWQVHPGAAATFVSAVMSGIGVRPGERVLDLYCGAGLFAAAASDEVGPAGQVVAVESDPGTVAVARELLEPLGNAVVVPSRVDDAPGVPRPRDRSRRRARESRGGERARSALLPDRADIVVLDPPRTGAGREVSLAVARMTPRAVAYVACDPAALARDLATFLAAGYCLASLRAFDAFPMTHHVECVALLTRTGSDLR